MTSSASVSNNQMRKDKKHRVMRCFFMNIKGILPGAVSGTKNYNFAGMRKSRDDKGEEVARGDKGGEVARVCVGFLSPYPCLRRDDKVFLWGA